MKSQVMYDAVCVGAHPDDVEIGMGATVAKMVREGLRVMIVDLTNGEPTPYGTPEKRASESAEAASILGADRLTLGGHNRYLFDTKEARIELAEVLRELQPSLLFTPYPDDAHPDHVAAAQIALAARFYSKFTKTDMRGEPWFPRRVYHYMAVHQRMITAPSFIVDVTDDLAAKIAAVSAYRSQFAENPANVGLPASLEQEAVSWGSAARVGYGEPFFALEPVCIASVSDLL